MAIIIKTQRPQELINSLNRAINRRAILTWVVDDMGDYTISREQWQFLAWMRPYILNDRIVFGIIQSRKFPMTKELYGVYHGRFVATLLSHFDLDIIDINVTPLLTEYDVVDNIFSATTILSAVFQPTK